jgi:hypothetical protein
MLWAIASWGLYRKPSKRVCGGEVDEAIQYILGITETSISLHPFTEPIGKRSGTG